MLPDKIIEVDYAEAELRYAAGLVREGDVTWQNLMETVVSDRLEEDLEPVIEVGRGPSPMNFLLQQDSPLLDLLGQFPQHYRRDREVEWPDSLAMQDTVMVDLATEPDMTGILIVYGISEEEFNVARAEWVVDHGISWHHGPVSCMPFCTPSRNPITG